MVSSCLVWEIQKEDATYVALQQRTFQVSGSKKTELARGKKTSRKPNNGACADYVMDLFSTVMLWFFSYSVYVQINL